MKFKLLILIIPAALILYLIFFVPEGDRKNTTDFVSDPVRENTVYEELVPPLDYVLLDSVYEPEKSLEAETQSEEKLEAEKIPSIKINMDSLHALAFFSSVKFSDTLTETEVLLADIPVEEINKKNDKALEIDNIILNETVTKIGKDFYDVFYKNWSPPENMSSVVVIEEKPMPSLGTRVSIKVNDYYIFQRVLQPRYETIKDAAITASNTVTSFLYNFEQIEKNLQGEDMEGTGIF